MQRLTDVWSLRRWRTVLAGAALAQILFDVLFTVVDGDIVAPVIVWSALLTIGLLVLGRYSRTGAALLGFVSLVRFAASAAFLADNLGHPESFWDFWLGWSMVLSAGLGVLAAAAVWRRADGVSPMARAVSSATMALIVTLGVVGGTATIAYDSEAAHDGDIALRARNARFEPANVTANVTAHGGGIAVFVDNDDSFRHTLSIDALDVDLEIPGAKAARVEFVAEPGTYEFICDVPGHEKMKGVLVVSAS